MNINMASLLFKLVCAFCLSGTIAKVKADDSDEVVSNRFPKNFLIGVASSAYQVEGGWNADGKGENIWDRAVHTTPDKIENEDNGDIACDSYHKFKEDVQLVKIVGFNHYRFSLSWTRILPTGYDNATNQAGLTYYHNLIDDLLRSGIIPVVTLYHWDLPQPLQELGGWTNPLIADYFEDYARVVFKEFGDKVKYWITINEPYLIIMGYNGNEAPFINQSGIADYLAGHNVLRAHAKAYKLYNTTFRPTQKGKIGITISASFYEPKTNTTEDQEAANRAMDFESGIFAHPIFSEDGDYPPEVREIVDANSKKEGFSRSRLPVFTQEEIQDLKGSADFFGLNHYTTGLATSGETGPKPSILRDSRVVSSADPAWKTYSAPWLQVVPEGMRGILNRLRTKYNNPPVFITENGIAVEEINDDKVRIEYHHDYMQEMLKALYLDGCNVFGYTVWSIMDNFEWTNGYTKRFGIHYVDFNDPNRPRTPKQSAKYFNRVMKTRQLPSI